MRIKCVRFVSTMDMGRISGASVTTGRGLDIRFDAALRMLVITDPSLPTDHHNHTILVPMERVDGLHVDLSTLDTPAKAKKSGQG